MSEKSTAAAVPEAQQSAQERVKEITDKLEAGLKALFEGDNFKNYLNTMSKFHNYSFNNTMLIALQKPEATYVAGFNSWKKNFERSVNKGEKGIKIFAPAPYKLKKEQEKLDPDTDKPILDKDGNPVMEEVEVTIPAFKVVSVFDVSQTNGKELPTLGVDELKGDVENFEKFFGVLKDVSPVPIKFAEIDGTAKGFYHQENKDITIKQDMPEVQTIKTAIHEIVHAKLHDRDLKKSDIDSPKKDRNTEEVEAESIAYTVCQHFGIDTSDYSFAYVASWGSGKDTPELKSSLETIRSTASELINQIEDKLRELEKERTVDKDIGVSEEAKADVPTADKPTEEKPRNSNIIGNTPYKDIESKAYLKVQTSQLPEIEKMLEEANISYSGRKTGKTTTLTVSEKDYSLLCDFATAAKAIDELSGKAAPQKETQKNNNIIGNTDYKDIPDKFFVRMSASKAQEIAAVLEKNGVQFSGRIEGDKATLTISKADKETYKQLTMSPEDIVKKTKSTVVEAMAEYDEAEKVAFIAEEKLDRAIQEYEEVKDENGQISNPELKERIVNNLRSAYVEKEAADSNFSDKEQAFSIAATEFEAASSTIKAAPEYTGRLPDMIPIAQMEEYGYKFTAENEMLPLENARATQLAELGADVYRLYEDNSEGLIEDLSEIKEHKGLFGIERAEWERYMPVVERIAVLQAEEPKREEILLHSDVPAAVGIYQLNEGAETRGIRYMSSDYLESMGIVPDRDKYTLVYSFEAVPEDLNNKAEFLDKVFEKYNSEPPKDYGGRSLSVSDVVVIRNGDDLSAHYVDSTGFKEFENFGEVHRKPELTAETAEQSEKTFIPLYKNDMMFAKENSEIEEWRSSFNENRSCARAIDKALSDNFADNHLDTDKALDTVIAEYGAERVTHVLAAQVVNHDWDGRYHSDVKAWAKEQMKDLSAEFIEKSRDYYLSSHPILIDGLASTVMTREKELEKAASREITLESAEQNGVNILSFSEQDGQIFAEVTQGEKSSVVPVKRTDEDIAYIEIGGKPNKLTDIQSYDLEQFEIYRSPITHDVNGYHADDLDKGDTIKLDGELWTVKSKSTYSISLVNDNGKKHIYNSPESKWQETITKAGFEFVSDEPVPRERTSNEQEARKPARSQPKPTPAKSEAEKKPSVIGAIEELKKNCSKQTNVKENEKGAVAL